MASAAGGSGAGGGDRYPSGEKGTTRVGHRFKKPSAFHRAVLRCFEKEYRECMGRGEEPPFDLEDLAIERHGGRPPTGALPSGNASAQRRRQRARCFVLTMAMAGASKVLLAFTAGRSPLPGRACRLFARRRVDSPPPQLRPVQSSADG